MMKKLLPLSIGLMMFSGLSHAGAIAATATITPDTTGSNPNQCVALNNDVTIQLSNGVVAGWSCSTLAFTAATCHSAGTYKQQTISCSYTEDKDPSSPTFGEWLKSASQCPDYDPTKTTQADKASFLGRLAYKGGSSGGSVAQTELPDTTVCSTTTIVTVLPY